MAICILYIYIYIYTKYVQNYIKWFKLLDT